MDWTNKDDVRRYHREWRDRKNRSLGMHKNRSVLTSISEWIETHLSQPNNNGCRLWTLRTDKDGYGLTSHQGKLVRVHRAVYEMHHGATPLMVCHACDVPGCAEITHLFAGTGDDNSSDMVQKGRSLSNGRNPNAKLDETRVQEIRAAYAASNHTLRDLAAIYGVSKSMVSYIVNGTHWKNAQPASGRDWT